MRYVNLVSFLILALLLMNGCQKNSARQIEQYKKEIEQWHQERIKRLTDKESWLSLAGLYWLKEGENTFGFGEGNDIVFPDGKEPLRLGSFFLKNGKVRVKLNPKAGVLIDSMSVLEAELKNDLQGKPTRMERGRFLWYVIKRGERYGIRLKDRQNPRIKNFKGIKRFPVRLKWRVKAKFIPYDSMITVSVPTILGTDAPSKSPGELRFSIDGQTFTLQALGDAYDEPFFIIFADETNGEQTYGAGRFLYVDPPDENGETYIDFNKAYNPPCAFTEFATCPLPPAQNRLPIKVTAGEMAYEHGVKH